MEIKKAIIPLGGLGTRFLPLSKVVPKELWPLVDLPVIHYLIKEAKDSGISEIIFVLRPDNKIILDYLKPNPKVEKVLKDRKKTDLLNELKEAESVFEGMTFSSVIQRAPLGDGNAIFQAAKLVGEEPCACLFADEVVDSGIPCLAQLMKVFRTSQNPILTVVKAQKEKLPLYGVIGFDKLANRLYKVKKIVEKPSIESAPSDLAIVGKYILTPEVFAYLKKAKPSERGEVILADVLDQMLKDGKIIFAHEFQGVWLNTGTKIDWLKSNLYLALKHPKYGQDLRDFIKQI